MKSLTPETPIRLVTDKYNRGGLLAVPPGTPGQFLKYSEEPGYIKDGRTLFCAFNCPYAFLPFPGALAAAERRVLIHVRPEEIEVIHDPA